MSLIMDLPTLPSSRYTKQEIHVFNLYRKEYREFARYVRDNMYGSEVVTVMDPDTRESKLSGHMKLLNMIYGSREDEFKNSQLLYKYTIGKRIGVSHDVITAVYVPEFVDSYTLHFCTDHYCEGSSVRVEKTLEEQLQESKTIPSTNLSEENLKRILRESVEIDTSYKHDQRKSIEIDGIRYVRTIPVQPALYRCDGLSCYDATIKLNKEYSEEVVVYLETTCLRDSLRQRHYPGKKVMFLKDSANKLLIQEGLQLSYGCPYVEPTLKPNILSNSYKDLLPLLRSDKELLLKGLVYNRILPHTCITNYSFIDEI